MTIDLLSTEAVKVSPGTPVFLEGWGGDQPLRARVGVVEPLAFTKVSALGVEEQRVNVVADFVDPPGSLGDAFRVEARVVLWSGMMSRRSRSARCSVVATAGTYS